MGHRFSKAERHTRKQERLNEIETAIRQGQRVTPRKFMRHLKHNHTEAELLMWNYLQNAAKRKGQRGMRFRQQTLIGPYFADFYCPKAKLVVEVDGSCHEKEYDQRRDNFMASQGLVVLRFKNDEVLADIQTVLSKIYNIALNRYNFSGLGKARRCKQELKM